MKCFAVVATLAVLSVAHAGTLFRRPLHVPRFQVVPLSSQADGTADGSITTAVQETPHGVTQVETSASQSAGQTSGLGSISVNRANTDLSRTQTAHGVSQSADADSSSVQDTTGGLLIQPIGHLPFPILIQPIALGQAGGSVTTAQQEGPAGFSRVTSISSSASGSAADGGSSINSADASNTRTETAQGVQETSNTGSESVQRT